MSKTNEFKRVSTTYLSFTSGSRISSSVIVTPAKLELEKSYARLEASFDDKYLQIQKLGHNKRHQVINGQVSLEIDAAFQIVDHTFWREQNTYLYVIMCQVDNEMTGEISRKSTLVMCGISKRYLISSPHLILTRY